jgi:hypothetical protein
MSEASRKTALALDEEERKSLASAETIFTAPAAVVDVHMLFKGMRLVHTVNAMHEVIKQFGGVKTLSRSTVYRVSEQTLKERLAEPKFFDIAGLHESFVASFYSDTAVIKMMIMEFRLRAAAFGRLRSEEALFLLPQAISMLAEVERNPSATMAYRIAVSSFGLQVHVYCSRVPGISDEARFQHLLEARQRAEAIADESLRVLSQNDDIGLVFQAVRIECNAFHIENILKPLAERLGHNLPSGPLDRTKKSVARRVALERDVSSQIMDVAKKFGDPRLPLNPAEAAGSIGEHYRAKTFLQLSMTLDGYQGKVRDWKPKWLPEGYFDETPDLQQAIQIIDGNKE